MTILKGDVIFARGGDPVRITSKDKATGNVTYEKKLETVQDATQFGVKNGLSAPQREAFQTVLSEVENDDARTEIETLAKKIDEMKKEGGDPRLIRYLKGELQFRMTRDRIQPEDFQVDELSLISS
jgi:hypothetical protein